MTQDELIKDYLLLLARVLLSVLFIISGLEKVTSYQVTAAFMQASSIPAWLLPLVIGTEVIGGIAVLFGYKTRAFALVLALFCVAAVVIFHHQFSNKIHFILFWSGLAIAGGLLALFASGAGRFSVEHRLGR